MSTERSPEAVAFEREFPGARWLAARTARELEVVGGMVDAAIGGVTRRHGLSHAALNALAVIEGEGGPMLTGEVATRMHISSGSVTSVLDTLERKGLVVRSADAGDRRRVLVDVTPEAQALLDDLLPRVQQMAGAIAVTLSDEQIGTLLQMLGELRDALDDVPVEFPDPKPRRRPSRLTRPTTS